MKNLRPTKEQLQDIYNQRYQTGFFVEEYFTGFNGLSSQLVFLVLKDIKDKKVLDVGCGAGRLALIAGQFADSVDAFDLNGKAIGLAKIVMDCTSLKNVNFFVGDLETYKTKMRYDIIFYSETIEHVDDPLLSLKNLKRLLAPKGKIIVSCPNFQNLRGYSYMSFLTLFNFLMSPSDRREISPLQLEKWCEEIGLKVVKVAGALYERGWGCGCLNDMIKRLPLAVRDSPLPKQTKEGIKYDDYNSWLKDSILYTDKLLKKMAGLGILKTRPEITRFKFKRPDYLKDDKLWERTKFYLGDGENKENLYHCVEYPWNYFGGNIIVVAQN
jgi:2-polyprenyl-3-methyl-5-hydroxy-6-metoxy-1,4-benzoquinol methylase